MAVTELSEGSNFKNIVKGDDFSIVDFWAEWCGPCRSLSPILERLSVRDDVGATFYKVNVDNFPEVASEYAVMSLPTMMLFKKGEEIGKVVGLLSEEKIKNWIDSHR